MVSRQLFLACAFLTLNIVLLDLAAWALAWARCSHSMASSGKRVVFIADPQLTDRTSYESLPSGPLLAIVRWICDAYLARADVMVRFLSPDAGVILGDLMDGGLRLFS
ncbi:hypothetical protein T484DRAFT_1785760 [Baffinella frigidus]|nr:hypothetical protein T484DRAFT_1785760 [Cryptophyta sp. CCMP2293]